MAHHRIKTAVTCFAALCILRATAPGCGGWDEEEPATLDQTLPGLPSKSLGQIVFETTPAPVKDPAPDFAGEIDKISVRIGKDSPTDLVKAVDDLLAKARLNYQDDSWCNVLEDLRDLVTASSQNPDAVRGYLRWRLQHLDWLKKPQQDPNAWPAQELTVTPQRDSELDLLTGTAPSPLKAHWLYLRGAMLFKLGDRKQCRKWFEEVIKEFPDHPRAEVARFLLARCDFADSRSTDFSVPDDKLREARKKAIASFEEFRRRYPDGRLDADALGWLGALKFDDGDSPGALQCYIAQAEDQHHPEIHKSAVFMCEKVLSSLQDDERAQPVYELMARHPQVAMAYIYQVVNAAKQYEDDQADSSATKKWRRTTLLHIVAEVAKQHDLYKSDDWQPRYLAMLALAASDSGDQVQALQITNVAAEEINRNDDLLFARGLALQRAHQSADAIAAYRELQKRFPVGPLTSGARLRLAMALLDNHEAGAALIELRSLRNGVGADPAPDVVGDLYPTSYNDLQPTDSAISTNVSGVYGYQIDQAIDAILNFAPIGELEVALDNTGLDDDTKKQCRAVIAERCLVAENFAGAKKYMTPTQYSLVAANLERLTQAAAAAPAGRERAAKLAALGDAWAQARGRLLGAPLGNRSDLNGIVAAKDEGAFVPGDTGRRSNGLALGFSDVDRELEDRDELRHAARWWMRAARESPGTLLDAATRWKALEAIPLFASISAYTEQRARETGAGEASREIYDKLRTECPDSAEAKKLAAYWSFPAPAPKNDDKPIIRDWDTIHFDDGDDHDLETRGYQFRDDGAFNITTGNSDWEEFDDSWKDIAARVSKLRDMANTADVPHMAAELDDLTQQGRKKLRFIEQLSSQNFLDDMDLFAREKGVTPKMLQTYLDIRLNILSSKHWPGSPEWGSISSVKNDDGLANEIDKAVDDPDMKPVADYLACARIALMADHQHEDLTQIEQQCRDFLKTYPHSSKREAVMFVLARVVRSLTVAPPDYPVKPDDKDNAEPQMDSPQGGDNAAQSAEQGDAGTAKGDDELPQDRDGSTVVPKPQAKKPEPPAPFDPKPLLEVLDAYDREFPKGRYAADIRDYRAYVAWRAHDWGKALDLTLPALDDASAPLLQGEAALRLANIFAWLAQSQERASLMDAIRQRPAAKNRLKMYLAVAPKDIYHPLRYLQAYLTDQLELEK